jgi:protocatechuate 3,4-dioxygenase beta subunit
MKRRLPPTTRRSAPEERQGLAVPILLAVALMVLPVVAWWLVRRPPKVAHTAATAATAAAPTPRPRKPPPRPLVIPALPPPEPPAAEDDAEDAGEPDAAPAVVDEGPPVSGRVLDPDGRPVEGASVACEDRSPPIGVDTDGDGRFQLPGGAAGCTAIARRDAFSASDRVHLVAGRDNTLQLGRPGGIDGDVVDEQGAPVPAFVIAVESYRGPEDGGRRGRSTTVNDPAGAFALAGLPPGDYVLTAGAEGRPPVFSRPVTVERGRTTHHVRITLPVGATLTGTVLDADTRRPIAAAVVQLDAATSTGASKILPATSDDTGAYTLHGAPPGPFSIRVVAQGYRERIVAGLTTRGGASVRQDVALHPASDGTRGELAGIGAYLAPAASGPTIGSVVPGGPADTAGLLPGDRIGRIDGADVSASPVSDCIQRLRGPEGSRVDVQVDRSGQRVDITIERRAIVY